MNEKDSLKQWIGEILQKREVAKHRLFSVFNMKRQLEQFIAHPTSPIVGLRAEVRQHRVVFDSGIVGSEGDNKKSIVSEPLVDDSPAAVISIDVWPKNPALSTTQIFESLRGLISELWMPDARQTKFGSLDYQQNSVKSRLDKSVGKDSEDEFYAVFYDLDGFKAVNDNVGYHIGDNVLRDVSASVEALAHDVDMVGVCKGGDEFGLIIKGDILAVYDVVLKLKDVISSRSYGPQGLKINFTSGIVRMPFGAGYAEIDKAFTDASKCMTETVSVGKGGKKKGTVSFATDHLPGAATRLSARDFVKLGLCMAWIRQADKAPFSNIFLNIVSARVSDLFTANTDPLPEAINQFIFWLGLQKRSELSTDELVGPQIENVSLSELAIAIAVVHGVLRSKRCGSLDTVTLCLESETQNCSVLFNAFQVWGGELSNPEGFPAAPKLSDEGKKDVKRSSALAVKVGFAPSSSELNIEALIKDLFNGFVVVDDRPKTGGGLPDFWQAAVAHVFWLVAEDPNIKSVYIFGDPANAPETIKRLSFEGDLDVNEIAAVTLLPQTVIQECRARLSRAGAINEVTSDVDLIEKLYQETFGHTVWAEKVAGPSRPSTQRMRRRLDVADLVLRPTDGLRCSTAAQAYPLIVEILRTSESVSTTFDDASQTLSEVIGFKLALEKPHADSIPEYWYEQHKAFDEYANDVLIDVKSTIGRHFHAGGQFDAFLAQLFSYCNDESKKKSTRRAILVVPNEVSGNVMKPLGLVSLWATPRFSQGVMSLEFCFVWRTVEALVGLPYSLFGSIKLSEYICSSIQKKLADSGSDLSLQIGGLTYLALSLHMRTDEFHMRIAKRIVDAASS
jgi:diguanylate cyclase (GGDEF)-like protein